MQKDIHMYLPSIDEIQHKVEFIFCLKGIVKALPKTEIKYLFFTSVFKCHKCMLIPS